MNEQFPTKLGELHAYVDEQLSPEARKRVEARLAGEPEAKRVVEDYAAIGQGLKTLFDPVLREPIPERLSRRPRRWTRPLGAVVASLFLLATGTLIGIQLQGGGFLTATAAPHVVHEAAMAYAVYTPEKRRPVEVAGGEKKHLAAWLTERLGAQVPTPHLDTLGFFLVGGRLLSSDDGPGALLMYENDDGQRVVLYLCQNEEKDRSTTFRFASDEGVSVFYWFNGPFSYALAGVLERDGMLGLAEAVYNQVVI